MLTAILEVSAQYQVSVLNATKDAVSMRCVGYGGSNSNFFSRATFAVSNLFSSITGIFLILLVIYAPQKLRHIALILRFIEQQNNLSYKS